MSERRFIIAEMGDWGQPVGEVADYVVTESELLHRLYLIRTLIETGQSLCQLNERGIDILLHGEKEQPWPGPVDIIEMRGKEQPKEKQFPKEQDLQKFDGIPAKNQAEIHKKQPDEWEEWAEAAAHVLVVERYDNTLNAQELKVKEVLFSIPCNPRRKL